MPKFSEKYAEYNETELVGALEAVLFVAGEPVSREKLSELFEITPNEIELVAQKLEKSLDERDAGFQLIRCEGSIQFCTRALHAPFITRFLEIKRNAPISKPALEALSVIAYRQPVTKGYVEQVRGVDCSGIINALVEKGLVEEKGRLDAPGRPILYGTTLAFLKCFGLNSLSELPEVDDDQQKIQEAK